MTSPSMVIDTTFVVVLGIMAFSAMMLIRNEWVYRWRMKAIEFAYRGSGSDWIARGCPRASTYVREYSEMMALWWVWDIRRFAKRPAEFPGEGA